MMDTAIYYLPAFVVGIVLHECAHAYVAWKLGDPTGKNLGRITLNPLAHLDPVGTVMMFVAGIGWANPVPIVPRNFAHPRRDMALAAGAGPLTNIMIAVAAIAAINLMPAMDRDPMLLGRGFSWFRLLLTMAQVNAVLAVFNLIPLKPLDGHHFLEVLLPARQYIAYKRNEMTLSLVGLVLLMSGALQPVFSAVQSAVTRLCVTSYFGV